MDATVAITGLPAHQHRRVVSADDPQHPIQNVHKRNQSEQGPGVPDIGELDDEKNYYGGAFDALAPVGISFRGPNRSVRTSNAAPERFARARAYLHHKFNVTSVHVHGRWLVLGCAPAVPSSRMPGLAGGFLAIWRPADRMYFQPFIGEEGQKYLEGEEEDEFKIDEAILARFEPGVIPRTDAVLGLASLFPECVALTFVAGTIVIEYPTTDEQSFEQRLQTLPDYLPKAPFAIRYHNGPLPNTPQRRRLRKPRPQLEEDSRVEDETDYVARDGKFYPGSMISSIALDGTTYCSVSAGVLLFNQDDVKLTCPWHNWEDHAAKYPALLGENNDEARRVFTMVQGEPGTKVGHVVKRVGNTDIALASLLDGVDFENRFMDIQACAKRLVHSNSIQTGDIYVIDGFTTGSQRLVGLGARFELGMGPAYSDVVSPSGGESVLPSRGTYIAAKQGVSGTIDDVQAKPPYIRGRACGAVLVRVRDGQEVGGGSDPKETLARGEVCGVFHYADLTSKYRESAADYLAYTEVFDPLIEEGWRVVPAFGEAVQENVVGPPEDVSSLEAATPRRTGLRSQGRMSTAQ
ncbi:uncharacterized protein C8A04DRAFT_27825 [Dichotomopilus funicola]|uniref:Uncharacterized protein n=1 Tax=Dichotomopilus funicola TaxID=1934379 RepID=A0AAN6V4R2_9PEZI|nr:hypothetical protein C8A04DRAFT_27825 [Dichotomopilus funicola]